jgi:hypothetical protein
MSNDGSPNEENFCRYATTTRMIVVITMRSGPATKRYVNPPPRVHPVIRSESIKVSDKISLRVAAGLEVWLI